MSYVIWRIVNFLIIAPYEYSYLLTYLFIKGTVFGVSSNISQI